VNPDNWASNMAERAGEQLDSRLEGWQEEDDRFGLMLRHPLVYHIPHSPMLNWMVNDQLRLKLEALEDARRRRDWHTYVWLHERPYRSFGFRQIRRLLTDEEYWPLLGRVWIDTENLHQHKELPRYVNGPRPQRELIMDEDEQEALAGLPPRWVTIWRGYSTGGTRWGWSWTTDRQVAAWFAHRQSSLHPGSLPRLMQASVPRSQILAYFTRRNESEVVASPRLIDRTTIRDIRNIPKKTLHKYRSISG
jgi:hypothetical protein